MWRCSTENKLPRAQYSSTIAGGERTTPSNSTMFGCRNRAMMPTSFSSSSRVSASTCSSSGWGSGSSSCDSLSDELSAELNAPSSLWMFAAAAATLLFRPSAAARPAAAVSAASAFAPTAMVGRPRCFSSGSLFPWNAEGGPSIFTATSVWFAQTAQYTRPKLPSPTHFLSRISVKEIKAVSCPKLEVFEFKRPLFLSPLASFLSASASTGASVKGSARLACCSASVPPADMAYFAPGSRRSGRRDAVTAASSSASGQKIMLPKKPVVATPTCPVPSTARKSVIPDLCAFIFPGAGRCRGARGDMGTDTPENVSDCAFPRGLRLSPIWAFSKPETASFASRSGST
mmetsp:Transcript_9710/g.36019  ORF Transcript_9710/g.36019 Transcript_9710/m.36019 type:complete len:345 (-) Transcript_9710:1855-2889(-)